MVDPLSQVFAALADPIRRDIVARLAGADATVGELAEPYRVSVQAVSKHLKVLEAAGLVSRSREAQRRPVPLEPDVHRPAAARGARPPPRARGRVPPRARAPGSTRASPPASASRRRGASATAARPRNGTAAWTPSWRR